MEHASTKDELKLILEELRDETAERSDEFSKFLQANDLERARLALVRMKYLASIEKSLKEKMLKV